jgi:hypothetical protein
MKKNLFFAAAIAVVAIFSSCTPAAEVEPTVTVKIDSASYKTGQGINGSITLTAGELSTVVLDSAGTVIKTYTTFTKAPITGSKESYIVKYDSLAAGKYTLKATLKTGQYGTKAFDVVKKTTPVVIPTLTSVASDLQIFSTLSDGSNKTTCASINGMAYEPKTISVSDQSKIDFVYFYYQMYSPSAAKAAISTKTSKALLPIFANWTNLNSTVMVKSTLNYSTSTYAEVVTAIGTSALNIVADLKVGDVVAFKTSGNKYGLFKVNSFSTGANVTGFDGTDYIKVDIKVQQ